VAVSGGSDSVALLLLLHAAQGAGKSPSVLRAVTVDHGLRAEAATEAAWVGDLCAKLGVPHDILHLGKDDVTAPPVAPLPSVKPAPPLKTTPSQIRRPADGGGGGGNLQGRARQGRYRLMAKWARDHDLAAVAVGHTLDDQAETVVMRLGRASGVRGLSAMLPVRQIHDMLLLRPMLGLTRQELRDWLSEHNQTWVDDPSNQDTRYDRVQIRGALDGLSKMGVSRSALARTAAHMARSDAALTEIAIAAATDLSRIDHGDVVFDAAALWRQPDEIIRRLIVGAIQWVAGLAVPPRSAPVAAALDDLRKHDGGARIEGSKRMGHMTRMVAGCALRGSQYEIRVGREYNAVATMTSVGDVWDRWRIHGPPVTGAHFAALGVDGLRDCADWRDTAAPRDSLIASPAMWLGNKLIAAPMAGHGPCHDPDRGPEKGPMYELTLLRGDDWPKNALSH
jgi:tRNA(Ile)-lysidine synthase